MATERLEPDVLVADSGWAGTPVVGDIQDDPDTKTWPAADPLRANNNNTSTSIHTSFPSPTGDLTIGADLQEFRVLCRQFDTGQTGTPDIRLELWEFEASTWSLVRAGSDIPVTGTDQVVAFTFNANELTTISGANVGIKAFGIKASGGGGVRNSVDMGAAEWNVDYADVAIDLAATLAGVLTVAAELDATGKLESTLAGVFAIAADLAIPNELEATLAGVFAVAADLDATGKLEATLAGALAVVADLDAKGTLATAVSQALSMTAEIVDGAVPAPEGALYFPIEAPWTEYPNEPKINKSYWQGGRNLLSFWPLVNNNARGLRDLVGYRNLQTVAGRIPDLLPNNAAQALGRRWDPATSNDKLVVDASAGFGTLYGGAGRAESWTIIFKCRSGVASQRQYLINDVDSGSSNRALYLRVDTGNTWTALVEIDDSNDALVWQQGTFAADTDYSVALICNWELEGIGLYIDGALIGGELFPASPTAMNPGAYLALGAAGGINGAEHWRGEIWDQRIYRGALTLEQIAEIHRYPLRVFEPEETWYKIGAAAEALYFPIEVLQTGYEDDFERVNIGSAWEDGPGWFEGVTLVGGALRDTNSGSPSSGVRRTAETYDADQWSEITVKTLVNGTSSRPLVYPMVRVGSPVATSYYLRAWNDSSANTEIALWNFDGVSSFNLIGTTFDAGRNLVAGDRLRIEVEGTALRGYLNDVLIDTATDSDYSSGQPGCAVIADTGSLELAEIESWRAGNMAPGKDRWTRPQEFAWYKIDATPAPEGALYFPIEVLQTGYEDDFERVNIGNAWENGPGWYDPCIITNGQLESASINDNCTIRRIAETYRHDQWAEATLATDLGSGGAEWAFLFIGIGTPTATAYYAYLNGTGSNRIIQLRRHNGSGGFTQIGSAWNQSGDFSTGDVIRIERVDNEFWIYRNGVLVVNETDSTYSGGQPGLGCPSESPTSPKWEDWRAGNMAPGYDRWTIAPEVAWYNIGVAAEADKDLVAALTNALTVVADLDAAGKLETALISALTVVADLDATGKLEAALTSALTVVAELDAAGKLEAALTSALTVAADLDATGKLEATLIGSLIVAADLDATGKLEATLISALTVAANLTAPNELEVTLASALTVVAELDATGKLEATLIGVLTVAADLDATGKLEVALINALTVVADITGAAPTDLSAVLANTFAVVADLSAQGTLTSTQVSVLTVAADLSAQGKLEAAIILALTVAADLDAAGELEAATAIQLNVVADLDAAGELTTNISTLFSIAADLSAIGSLQTPILTTLTVVAAIESSVNEDVSAVLANTFTVAADLSAQGALTSTQVAALTMAVDLSAQGKLEAAVTLTLLVAADLDAVGKLEAATALQLTVAADLDAAGGLSATPAMLFSIAADLDAAGSLDIAVASISNISAVLVDGNAAAVPPFPTKRHIAPFWN